MEKITDEQRIQISRSKYIEESRAIAYLRLREKHFLKGEVCMLNYYKNKDYRNNIGVLIAIGVEDGIGENCFRIVSAGGIVPVRNVVDSTVDVSKLVHGELYIYHDLNKNEWRYFKTVDIENKQQETDFDIITGGPYIFIDLETGYRWFYNKQTCKREDEFFSSVQTEEILQDFLTSDIKVYVDVLNNKEHLFKTGALVDVKLNIEAKTQQGELVNDKCDFYIGDNKIILDKEGNYILPGQTESRDITIEARYKVNDSIKISYYGSTSFRFGYDFYYGPVNENWEPTNFKGLHQKLYYKNDFLWDGITLKNQSIVLAYPLCYGYLKHIFDVHGLDYIHSYQAIETDIVLDGQQYLCYILKSPIDISDFRQCYSFSDTETQALEEANILDVVGAWKDKNNIGGLVVLDDDGKIPSNLYDVNIKATLTPIKGMVTEYPTEGMIEGELYYNTITKKIYKALSETTGVEETPIPCELYSYNGEIYTWSGKSLRPYSRFGFREIKKIEEIYGRN